ncbi:hypothetical protein V6N11_024538 [Hibiscus sabdariffa]|uniref:Uncharacterized protein n=1 Tax=Hibiscus sabdariffa TaxID=183260 RepID=A0ABR2QME0_9ROSI
MRKAHTQSDPPFLLSVQSTSDFQKTRKHVKRAMKKASLYVSSKPKEELPEGESQAKLLSRKIVLAEPLVFFSAIAADVTNAKEIKGLCRCLNGGTCDPDIARTLDAQQNGQSQSAVETRESSASIIWLCCASANELTGSGASKPSKLGTSESPTFSILAWSRKHFENEIKKVGCLLFSSLPSSNLYSKNHSFSVCGSICWNVRNEKHTEFRHDNWPGKSTLEPISEYLPTNALNKTAAVKTPLASFGDDLPGWKWEDITASFQLDRLLGNLSGV